MSNLNLSSKAVTDIPLPVLGGLPLGLVAEFCQQKSASENSAKGWKAHTRHLPCWLRWSGKCERLKCCTPLSVHVGESVVTSRGSSRSTELTVE